MIEVAVMAAGACAILALLKRVLARFGDRAVAMAAEQDLRPLKDELKRSATPVSAFFLIDSPEAIAKCIQELGRLSPYGMPDMSGSPYFARVREIYESGRVVRKFDQHVPLRWNGQDYRALLRLHSVDEGRYEVEMWLPGVIANDAAGMFKDGREGFFCAFLPPAFYA